MCYVLSTGCWENNFRLIFTIKVSLKSSVYQLFQVFFMLLKAFLRISGKSILFFSHLFFICSKNSSKICIRLLINLLKFNQRSVTAKNLRNIADRCNKDLNIIDKCIVKNFMTFQEIPLEEEWRIPFLNELISAKK